MPPAQEGNMRNVKRPKPTKRELKAKAKSAKAPAGATVSNRVLDIQLTEAQAVDLLALAQVGIRQLNPQKFGAGCELYRACEKAVETAMTKPLVLKLEDAPAS